MTFIDVFENPYVASAVIALVGGLIGNSIRAWATNRRTEAMRDATSAALEKTYVDKTGKLLDQYIEALSQSRAETAQMRLELASLHREVSALQATIKLQTTELEALNVHVEDLSAVLLQNGVTPPLPRRRAVMATKQEGV